MNKVLLLSIIILAIIVIVYIKYYYKYPESIGFIQSDLNAFTLDMFLKKQPIIINDQIQDIEAIGNAWFNGKLNVVEVKNSWYKNSFKNLLIYNPSSPKEIYIASHKTTFSETGEPITESNIYAIELGENQLVILPLHWHILIEQYDNNNCWTYGHHDFITRFLPK